MAGNTITIRKMSDEDVSKLKEVAASNHRSMEAQARSILEEYLAGYVAHKIMTTGDLIAEMHRLLEGEGLGPDEDLVPPRDTYMRPVDFDDDDDCS
ncbi:FitA-like ribbon-helix-helix domain-containing protein [Bifidobacterium leontopitheci]|uniref:Plasmid stability protein n=1 Tax=Bifidobacterium leontopitheci TaxID=2650774 RepID=A0A6I1GIA7_9BIFI|nr:DNA-binding protein [Bifidobacterium leontopitheci]KAB7790422.1 plasmid stability protein [Bifidobacterium leontopitheci]